MSPLRDAVEPRIPVDDRLARAALLLDEVRRIESQRREERRFARRVVLLGVVLATLLYALINTL